MKTQIKNSHVSHLHFGIRNISCTHIFPLWWTFNSPSVIGHRFGGQPPPARQQRQSTEQTYFPEKRNPTPLSALERKKKPVQLKLNISIQFSNELLLPYILLLRPPFILSHTMARNFFLLRLEQQDLKQQQEEEEEGIGLLACSPSTQVPTQSVVVTLHFPRTLPLSSSSLQPNPLFRGSEEEGRKKVLPAFPSSLLAMGRLAFSSKGRRRGFHFFPFFLWVAPILCCVLPSSSLFPRRFSHLLLHSSSCLNLPLPPAPPRT